LRILAESSAAAAKPLIDEPGTSPIRARPLRAASNSRVWPAALVKPVLMPRAPG
jgi:hypothetical protein